MGKLPAPPQFKSRSAGLVGVPFAQSLRGMGCWDHNTARYPSTGGFPLYPVSFDHWIALPLTREGLHMGGVCASDLMPVVLRWSRPSCQVAALACVSWCFLDEMKLLLLALLEFRNPFSLLTLSPELGPND